MTRLTGMNVAGAAFAPTVLPGVEGVDFKFPTKADLQGWASMGFDTVRLSVLWERLQPALGVDLDPTYLASCLRVLDDAYAVGLKVLFDLHNYGRYRGELIGSHAVPVSAFTDTWKRITRAIMNKPALYAYGLMNEPGDMSWTTSAQYGVNGVRAADWSRPIYVAGTRWGQAGDWAAYNSSGPFVTDPAGKEIYEAHIYLDATADGSYTNLSDGALACQRLTTRIQPFLDWLKLYGKTGAIGEFDVPSNGDETWMNAVDQFYGLMQQNDMTSYYWGGGLSASNAGCLLPMSIGPTKLVRPVMQLLTANMVKWKA